MYHFTIFYLAEVVFRGTRCRNPPRKFLMLFFCATVWIVDIISGCIWVVLHPQSELCSQINMPAVLNMELIVE